MLLLRPELPLSATVVVRTSLLEKKGEYHLQESPSQQVNDLM